MPKIYLIRHEETELRGFIGRTDPPLTAAGREAAARKLGGLDVQAVYVSPLQRARQTAEAIRCAARPVVLENLAEIDFGEWDGLTWEQIESKWPALARRKRDNWFATTCPGGESWQHFCARVERALEQVRAGPKPAAIVAHVTVNAVLAARLLGADPARFRQEHGEILTCEDACPHPVR